MANNANPLVAIVCQQEFSGFASLAWLAEFLKTKLREHQPVHLKQPPTHIFSSSFDGSSVDMWKINLPLLGKRAATGYDENKTGSLLGMVKIFLGHTSPAYDVIVNELIHFTILVN